jgi:hypothetical protein
MRLAILVLAAGLALAAPVLEAADPAAMVYLQVPFGDVSAARPESASFGLKLGISRRDQDPFVTRPVDADPIRSSVDLRFTGDGARGLNLRGIGNVLGGRPLAFRGGETGVAEGRAIGPGIVAPERTGDGLRLDALGDPGWSGGAGDPR